ncbi:hypothetical protein ISF6_4725 [Piscinibacter sakaiensis]|uniref:Uncharacterized protein n=1 Tax=Piscinibacter sakaiensis TaxID=1547922 RepID=A0A0K8NX95_PISS1|nr:hypothetical protein ISF6_4725 [Piscinibacter sakaiensis]
MSPPGRPRDAGRQASTDAAAAQPLPRPPRVRPSAPARARR